MIAHFFIDSQVSLTCDVCLSKFDAAPSQQCVQGSGNRTIFLCPSCVEAMQ